MPLSSTSALCSPPAPRQAGPSGQKRPPQGSPAPGARGRGGPRLQRRVSARCWAPSRTRGLAHAGRPQLHTRVSARTRSAVRVTSYNVCNFRKGDALTRGVRDLEGGEAGGAAVGWPWRPLRFLSWRWGPGRGAACGAGAGGTGGEAAGSALAPGGHLREGHRHTRQPAVVAAGVAWMVGGTNVPPRPPEPPAGADRTPRLPSRGGRRAATAGSVASMHGPALPFCRAALHAQRWHVSAGGTVVGSHRAGPRGQRGRAWSPQALSMAPSGGGRPWTDPTAGC